jgi:hypothetical protein
MAVRTGVAVGVAAGFHKLGDKVGPESDRHGCHGETLLRGKSQVLVSYVVAELANGTVREAVYASSQ